MIVRARHVSMLRHIPRGGRHARLDAVSAEIAAEIPVLPASDFSDPLPCHRGHRIRGDHLWEVLGTTRPDGETEAVPARNLLEILSGDAPDDAPGTQEFLRAFVRTPIAAAVWITTQKIPFEGVTTRGDPREPKSREIVRDGRARSAAAARAFLGDEVAVVGDSILVRRHPLAYWELSGGVITLRVDPAPYANDIDRHPFDIGRTEEVLAGYYAEGRVHVPFNASSLIKALPKDPEPGTEALYYASVLPGGLIATVDSAKSRGVTQFSDEMVELYDRLRPYAEAGAIGALNLDEVEPALTLCGDMAWRLQSINGSSGKFRWDKIDGFLKRGRIGSLPRSAADEASLEALAP